MKFLAWLLPLLASGATYDPDEARQASLTAGLRGWAAQGDLAKVTMFLDDGADLSADNNYGITPLHAASEKGHTALVRLLVGRGAIADVADINGLTPLHYAALFSQPDAVEALIGSKNVSLEAQDAYRQRPLHLAAKSGCSLCTESLLRNGAEANAKDEFGNTPLLLAAFGKGEKIAEAVRVHFQFEKRGHHAAPLLELLAAGAEVNVQDQDGNSALHWAARGSWYLSAALLSQGADPLLLDADGRTPADWAKEEESSELTSIFEAYLGNIEELDEDKVHWITKVKHG